MHKLLSKKTVITLSKFRLLAFVLLLNIVANPVFAQSGSQLREKIEQGAVRYLLNAIGNDSEQENISINMVAIDDRIQIPVCHTPFNYHAEPASLRQSYISVRVSCGNNDWYLFTNARVSRTRTVVVTAGLISPGSLLTSENLRLAEVDVNQLRHTSYSSADELLGARMKRRVRNGQPIQANMLCFVCKGDRITISAQGGGMQVKTAGIARQDGVIGDNIQVINASSNKAIIAEVASTQTVVVNL